jgi:aconitate hydratase 2/2-methylisocitrate dehydratase
MDESELIKEGHYASFGAAGARTEMPGCSLCMGNQAQVREGATVISTSAPATSPTAWARTPTCSWARPSWPPSRPSWASIPTVAEYHEAMGIVNKDAAIYKYLNFRSRNTRP